ncbi:MAG TPA: hypothetical protein DEA08_15185 [Planctomycetes bacterium]|nr:hypothetical protein [Planctomycetota bacterium]
MRTLADRVTAELALRAGWVESGELERAAADAGAQGLPIGQVLVRQRLIRPNDLLELLRAADQVVLACPTCRSQAPFSAFDGRGPNHCPNCKSQLRSQLPSQLPERSATIAPVGTGRFVRAGSPVPSADAVDALKDTRPDSDVDPASGSALVRAPRSTPNTTPHASGRFLGTSSRRFAKDFAEQFGDYELVDELGRGGMGVVYKARRPGLERFVALKILLGGDLASKNQVKRFKREAEFASKLRHPAIVQIHDVGQVGDYHYLTMDFVEGESLSEVLKTAPPSDTRAAEIVRDIAAGLQHAHDQGVIHRDIKPANLMITRGGQPVVTDFGLARQADLDGETTQLTRDGAMVGTPFYMSPEQASGKRERVVPKSDVFALGVVLYELVCKHLPFSGETQVELCNKILYEEPIPPRRHRPDLDPDLETILLKSLEKDPDNRYSAGELQAELARFVAGDPIEARPLAALERLLRRLRRHRKLVLLGSAAFVVLELCAWGVARTALNVEAERVAHEQKQVEARLREELEHVVREREEQERRAKEEAAAAVRQAEQAFRDARRTPAGEGYQLALQRTNDLLAKAIDHELNRSDPSLRVWRARVRLHLRQRDLAQTDLAKAVNLDPQGPRGAEASYLQARLHLRDGEDARARAVLEEALARLGADHSSSWKSLLQALDALEAKEPDLTSAEAALERARTLDPREAEVYLLEARLHRANESLPGVRRALLRATELDPKCLDAWIALTRLSFTTDLAQAKEYAARARAIDPRDPEGLQVSAILAQVDGKFDEAIPLLQEVLAQRPEDADALFALAQSYRAKEQRTQADQVLRRLERAHPGDLRPYRERALEALRELRFERALEHLQRGIEATSKSPEFALGHEHLVQLYEHYLVSTGSFARTEGYIAKRLREQPHDGRALSMEVELALERGGRKGGRKRVTELLKEHPDSHELLLFDLQFRLVDEEVEPKAAHDELQKLVGRFGEDPDFLYSASLAFTVLLEDPRAGKVLGEALARRAPEDPRGPLALAQAALLQKQPEEALRQLTTASKLDPDRVETPSLLGSLLVSSGKPREAFIYLNNAFSLRPYDDTVTPTLLVVLSQFNPRQALSLAESYLDYVRAAKRAPVSSVLQLYGRLMLRGGRQGEALERVGATWKAHSQRYEVGLVYAELLAVTGQRKRARAVVAEVERLQPQSPTVKRLKEALAQDSD